MIDEAVARQVHEKHHERIEKLPQWAQRVMDMLARRVEDGKKKMDQTLSRTPARFARDRRLRFCRDISLIISSVLTAMSIIVPSGASISKQNCPTNIRPKIRSPTSTQPNIQNN